MTCRVLTFAYVAMLAGILACDANFHSIQGLQSLGNYIFGAVMMMMLLPYISISLYTNDKRLYLADVSAKRYTPSAYYLAKVSLTFVRGIPIQPDGVPGCKHSCLLCSLYSAPGQIL